MSRFPKDSKLKRSFYTKQPKAKIYVLCEGKLTEPAYIKDFANQYANDRVIVQPIPGVGVPLTVSQQAVELKAELLREARKSIDSFNMSFSVWCIVDIDEHPNVPEAKQLADANKIKFLVSNPCFELWGLLHLKTQDAHIHRHTLQSSLHKEMPTYHHKDNPIFDYNQIKNNYKTAKERAVTICNRRSEEGKPSGNPSTNVYELFECIIANGKK
jgi:hypothetical protein